MDAPTLLINEIFYSIQGESTWAGLPCVFVRTRGCHLRCSYCDTEYAFHEGGKMVLDAIIEEGERLAQGQANLWEITGGEPLLQKNVVPLMQQLIDAGKTVLIETSGACDISVCPAGVIRIMDLKTPGSGEVDRNDWQNIEHLNEHDEVKFVITDRADYDWAKQMIDEHDLVNRVKAILISAAAPMAATDEIAGTLGLSMRSLAEWVLADQLPVRMQTQLHKLIWDPMARGV